jgi:hypothetical protein
VTVVTAAYAAARGIRADVLVRATGTAWPLRVRGFPPRRRDGPGAEVLLVDFDDRFDPQAAGDATRRVEEYQRVGMMVDPGGS